MIELGVGHVQEPWYRRWLKLKPQIWLYRQLEDGREPLARFTANGHKDFWLWMDQQGEQMALMVKSLLDAERKNNDKPSSS
jgi:hypothetical protein